MDTTITSHHSLARILTSLVESKGERPLTGHIAQQLSTSQDGEERAVLAGILASLLSGFQDKYSENVLSDFVKSLVLSTTDDREEIIHKNLQLGGQIALSVPIILTELLVETESTISMLVSAASKSHAASDDAFEANMEPFLDKYCSVKLEKNQKPESPEFFQTLYPVVIQYLRFLKIVLLSETESARANIANKPVLTGLIFALIILRNFKIAELSCHVFRLLLGGSDLILPSGTSELVWDGIKTLLESSSHADLAFSIWLRWVSLSGSNSRPSEDILQQENYWILLQNGLTTGFNERRKFCLYILNSSLRLLLGAVDNKLIKYDPSSTKDSAAWAKYSTMIEIISLSTSTNQFLATAPDLRRLLKPSSPIYGSWIVVLMTLGLTSSCGPLQKAVWEFLLSLKGTELGKLLGDDRGKDFINEIFLPYSVAAHHFSVPKGNDNNCEYGDKLAGFLKKIIIQSRDAGMLLGFVDSRQDTIFAPARVYVMKGIMDGVVEISGHGLGVEEMAVLVRISKMKRFALLKTDLCISICFRILLSVELDRAIVKPFFNSVAEIFTGKEYLITQNSAQSLRELFAINKNISDEPSSMLTELLSSFEAYHTEDIPTKNLFRAVFLVVLVEERDQGLRRVLGSISTDKNKFKFLSLLFSCKSLMEEILQDPKARNILTQVLQNIGNNLSGNVFSINGYSTELAALSYHQRTHHFLNQLSNTTLMLVLKNAWDIIHQQGWVGNFGTLQRSNGFNLEVERLRGELLAVCGAAVSALVEKGHTINFPRKTEVLRLIQMLPLPMLDQNKHENTVKLRVVGKFLYSGYSLLNSLISRLTEGEELNDEYVTTLFDTTRKMLRYIDKGSLLRILECFQTVFRNAPTATKNYPQLDLLVRELWDCADVTSAVAVESLLEISLIRTVFDVSVICASFETNKALAETLTEIGNEIMKLSKGKRSLSPVYAGKLREAYLSAPDVFCACKWVVDIFIEFINYTPSKDPDFFTENSVARIFDEISSRPNHYEQYYEEREEMAQVYIFDVLSRLNPGSFSASAFANCLRDKIYAPWALNKPGMPVYSKWKKALQLQVLVVLERFVTAKKSALFINTAIATLCNEPHPRYRFLLEWIVALCIIRFPENRGCLWAYLQAPENPNPRLQASLLRVAIMIARELEEDLKEEFYKELLYTVIPLSNNNKVAVRHQATSMVLELWDDLAQWQYLRDNVVFQRLRQSILNSDFFKQVVATGKLENERTFDAKANYTFAGIFSGSYLLGGDEADIIPPELFSFLENNNPRVSFIPVGTTKQLESSTKEVEFTKTELETFVEAPLQTKSGSWDAKALAEANEHRRSKVSSRKDQGPDIIVIASLIENAYNLGGLSRVSEIMGVKTLCLNSKDSLKLKDFTSVSVSSEIWLPILELKVADIPDYIRAMKLEGYSAVGIEQTDQSVILGDENTKLPKRVVLLLGSEKYGIPAELLAELDLCVEIPQKGETRSMNVQTAAAVVLYEFSRRFG